MRIVCRGGQSCCSSGEMLLATTSLLLVSLSLVAAGEGVQLKDPALATSFADELYEIVSPTLYSIRLFSRQGWVGSHTTDKLQNYSHPLYAVSTTEELADFCTTQFFSDSSSSNNDKNKIALFVNSSLQSVPDLYTQLKNAKTPVAAVMLQYVNTSVCQNEGSGLACQTFGAAYSAPNPAGVGTSSASLNPDPNTQWVPAGASTVQHNFSFPIFQLPDQDSSEFVYAKASANEFVLGEDGIYSVQWPYVAAEPHLYLGPEDMDSIRCLEMSTISDGTQYCDPLGGQSIFSELPGSATGPVSGVSREDSVVLVAAPIDARTLIQIAPGLGAEQTVSGLVAMLAAADAISSMDRTLWPTDKRVVFAGFQAERYGFLGSRGFLNDLFSTEDAPNANGYGGFKCEIESPYNNDTQAPWCVQPFKYSLEFQNINPEKISHVIAVDSVGTGTSDLYTHVPTTSSSAFAANVRDNAQRAGVSLLQTTATTSIPPSPVSSAVQAGFQFDGVTIAGYDSTFTTPEYMGPGDVLATLSRSKIASASVAIVEAVLAAMDITDTPQVSSVSVNATLVDDLLSCFLGGPDDDSCSLYNQYAYLYQGDTVYAASPTAWMGSPSTAYGEYTLYTGAYNQPYFYRAGQNWDPSYTQVNWLHRVGAEFVPFEDDYLYNADTDSLTVPVAWNEFLVWSFLADRFGRRQITESGSSACTTYTDCTSGPNVACISGECVKHFTFLHDARSTALSALDYKVYDVATDTMYDGLPLYTEPRWGIGWWDTAQIRVFIPVNSTDEWVLFGIGLVVTVASAFFIHFKLPGILTQGNIILEK